MGARHKVLPPLSCKHAAEERLSVRAESMIPACLRRFAPCGLRPSFAFPRDEVPLHAHEWGRVIKSFLRFRASTPRRRDFWLGGDHDSRMPPPLRALRPAPLIRILEGRGPSSCS
ncbi:hypothetical protein GCWU000341_01904 [Oribacterium sp. oral taxon 078 str. F0262]|nr:hypothetical protein GCWU000341_01904 [Oribacterium sp. oral taxon 078 str. F0262]